MTVRVLQGHVLEVLASLPARSVHTVCTSPPYWNLRAYQTEPQVWESPASTAPRVWDWGAWRWRRNLCDLLGRHEWGDPITDKKRGQAAGDTARAGNTQKRVCPPETQQGAFCTRCGAWSGELGSEPTLDLFVAHLVAVMAAVGRVLRDDGTLWVNLGDSYSTHAAGKTDDPMRTSGLAGVRTQEEARANKVNQPYRLDRSLPEGNLCMAPARFALAMQAAGWTLRSQIVLPKRAPMPESLQSTRWERCRVRTKPAAVVRRGDPVASDDGPAYPAHGHGADGGPMGGAAEWADCPGCQKCDHPDPEQRGYVQRWGSWRPTSAYEMLYLFSKAGQRYFADGEAVRLPVSAATLADGRTARGQRGTKGEYGTVDGNAGYNPAGRNLWNYVMWHPEGGLKEAHYASFPRFLPRLCIQAGTSERGVCPACGAPWLRLIDRKASVSAQKSYAAATAGAVDRHRGLPERPGQYVDGETTTLGWRQSCRCAPHEPTPATVLDPFSGSGTTLIEANALGRHGLGVELNGAYCDITHKRLAGVPLSLFAWEGQDTLGADGDAATEEVTG